MSRVAQEEIDDDQEALGLRGRGIDEGLRTVLCRPISRAFSLFTGSERHSIVWRDIIIVRAPGPVIDFAVSVSVY